MLRRRRGAAVECCEVERETNQRVVRGEERFICDKQLTFAIKRLEREEKRRVFVSAVDFSTRSMLGDIGDESTSSSGTTCSTPELDVVGSDEIPRLTPTSTPSATDAVGSEKRYLCQRCLNHGVEYPRKGHKPYCQYARCECADCIMVERRRQLNNQLSQRRLDPNAVRPPPGKKIRDPKCALCSAHGIKEPLKGHKKTTCPYNNCGCHRCDLVSDRRRLMARQIKLRRVQQKTKRQQEMTGCDGEQKMESKPLVMRSKSKSPELGMANEDSPQKPMTPALEELPTPVPIRPTVFHPSSLQPLLAAALATQNPFIFQAQHLHPLAAAIGMPLQQPMEIPLVPAFGAPAPQMPLWATLMCSYFRPSS